MGGLEEGRVDGVVRSIDEVESCVCLVRYLLIFFQIEGFDTFSGLLEIPTCVQLTGFRSVMLNEEKHL